MAYIGNIPAEKFTSVDIQNFTVSATANYTLDRPVANENEIELFINNVRQHPGSGKAYTASGTALTLSEATAGTDTMYCVYQGKARQTVTPATSSVTNAMLAGSIDLTSKVTGALPQANIADQAINEAKLQISNAPTNGYMLTAQSGNTGGLTWAEAPSGGVTLLNSSAATTGDSALSLTGVFNSTYEVYVVDVLGYQPSAAGYLLSQLATSSGYLGSAINYFSGLGKQDENSEVDNHVAGSGQTAIYLHPTSTRSDDHLNMKINIYLPTGVGTYKPKMFYTGVYIQDSGSKSTAFFGQTSVDTTSTITGMKFYPSTGTINDLQVKVYGFQKAT